MKKRNVVAHSIILSQLVFPRQRLLPVYHTSVDTVVDYLALGPADGISFCSDPGAFMRTIRLHFKVEDIVMTPVAHMVFLPKH